MRCVALLLLRATASGSVGVKDVTTVRRVTNRISNAAIFMVNNDEGGARAIWLRIMMADAMVLFGDDSDRL